MEPGWQAPGCHRASGNRRQSDLGRRRLSDAVYYRHHIRLQAADENAWLYSRVIIASKFKEALKGYAKLDQYIVFYFKPSGVEHFEKLTEAAKEAGFEIGYDAVGEEIVINFRKMR